MLQCHATVLTLLVVDHSSLKSLSVYLLPYCQQHRSSVDTNCHLSPTLDFDSRFTFQPQNGTAASGNKRVIVWVHCHAHTIVRNKNGDACIKTIIIIAFVFPKHILDLFFF